MSNKKNSLRAKKAKRKKKRRAGTTTVGEYERRKNQRDAEMRSDEENADIAATVRLQLSMLAASKKHESERNTMSKEEDDLITSEEYEEKATECIGEGDAGMAAAYATLALMATVRESTFIVAELIDPSDDDDGEESGEE